MLRSIKAHSSKWIHETFAAHERFAWQSGYGAFSVSESQVERVRTYIQDQETHHKRTTFEEEFVALLRAHGVVFDAEHLWK